MIQDIKDYTRCVLKNKVALGSYVTLGAGILSFRIERKMGIDPQSIGIGLSVMGTAILYCTDAGFDTMREYQKTRDHIKENGKIDERFSKKCSRFYCSQVGTKMAAKEAGLEDQLQNPSTLAF